MKRTLINTAILAVLGIGGVTTASAQQAVDAEIKLCAGEFDIAGSITTPGVLGNTAPIHMWGYSIGEPQGGVCPGTLTSPGPSILLPNNTEDSPTVTDLRITLYNTLPRATSLVIPGLIKSMSPVMFTPAGETIPRVHSFDTEVPPGGNVTYSWNSVDKGAYIYQSGTHSQVQVQMGLVGAVMGDAFTGTAARAAYPGLEYTELYPLIYSEIDPVIHAGVALGDYNVNDMQSTIDYAPKYFGLTLDSLTTAGCGNNTTICTQQSRLSTFAGDDITVNIANSSSPMIRLFNGSTRIHTPTLVGAEFDVIAEDGKLYPNYRKQFAVALPPLKTKDALLDTSGLGVAGGTIKLTDSAMNLSNPAPDGTGTVAAQAQGDVIANGDDTVHGQIHVEAASTYSAPIFSSTSPVARRDEATVNEGGSVSIDVLGNDANATIDMLEIVSAPSHGNLTKTATGYDYQHDGGESSRDSFLYKLAGQPSSMAGVVINVAQQNDNPVARDDSLTMTTGQQMEIRVLDNDTDVDSYDLTVVSVDAANYGLGDVTFVEKAITVSAHTAGSGSLQYTISDGDGGSATATVDISVTAASGAGTGQYTTGNNTTTGEESIITVASPIASDDSFAVAEGGTYDVSGNQILSVLANDTANGGVVSMDEYPEHGSIDMQEDGTFIYVHDGSEEDSDRFSYSVSNQGGSDKAEVVITIASSMDAPLVNDDRAKGSMNQPLVIDILDNDVDNDSDIESARFEIVAGKEPAHGVVSMGADHKLTYTPDDGFTGKDSFKYRLYDDITGEASSRKAKVKVKIK